MPDLQQFISPKSIAVVGASNTKEKVGGIVIQNLMSGYLGKIYPVNPNQKEIFGLTSFPDVNSLPELPDLVIIAIPADKALDVLDQIGQKGIKNVLIFSAGFKEAGEEGLSNEKKLLEIASKYELQILGPNCLGFVNNLSHLNATFGHAPTRTGNLRILSQSGAIATSLFDWSQNHSLGINEFITLGNKSVLNENHFLQLWSAENDASPEEGLSSLNPIGMYLESISDGARLIKLAKKNINPIFLLKPGKSEDAISAMKSHTGSLAGADEVLEAALKEANIIRADTLEDFFNLSKALSWENAPVGENIAIISNAGGPGVISADAVANSSLKLTTLSEKSSQLLSEKLPRSASLHNPIDVLGDALSDRFGAALDTVLGEESVHSVLVILTPQIMTQIQETAKIIGEKSKLFQKPIYCSFIGGAQVLEGEKILNKYRIPNFNYPEAAIKTLSLVYKWQKNKSQILEDKHQNTPLNPDLLSLLEQNTSKSKLLGTHETFQILDLLGLDQPSTVVSNDFTQAEKFAERSGWPLVLKSAENILHKSDDGGVITKINSFQKLKDSWHQLQNSPEVRLQLQMQIEGDMEVILGFKRDTVFGDVFFFGAGGKYVSLFQDKNIALFPLNPQKLQKTIEMSKMYPLLTGYRHSEKLDLNKLIADILKLANFFSQATQIKEMEINPVIMNIHGVFHVDPKIILHE